MARGPEKDDSVFDFMYADTARLSLFNSQFNQYGHLTTLTRSATDGSAASGGVNVGAAKLDKGSTSQTGQTRQFDTQWMSPLTFLDEAGRRGMLVRDLGEARVGQLVLATGKLEIRDLTILKKAFALPSFKATLQEPAAPSPPKDRRPRNDRRREPWNEPAPASSAPTTPNMQAFGIEFLGELPHALHASLHMEGAQIWCSLREEFLVSAPSDLFLKHGVTISGDWSIVGIMDARPEEENLEATKEQGNAEMQAAQKAVPHDPMDTFLIVATKGMGGLIDGIAPLARMLLGRPTRAYGMTPLLIFREVSG